MNKNILPILLIDFTGCLSDDEAIVRPIIEKLASNMGFIIDSQNRDSIWARWFGIGNQRIYEYLCNNGSSPDVYDGFQKFQDDFLECYELETANGKLKIRDGMQELLAYATAMSWPRAIVTNDEPDMLKLKLKMLGLAESDHIDNMDKPWVFQKLLA